MGIEKIFNFINVRKKSKFLNGTELTNIDEIHIILRIFEEAILNNFFFDYIKQFFRNFF